MDEQYIIDLYSQLGGESKFGKFEDFKSLITTDPSYQKDFHSAFGENTLGSFNDFSSLVSTQQQPAAPKKKEGFGGILSQPLEAVQEAEQVVQQESVSPSDQSSSVSPSTSFYSQLPQAGMQQGPPMRPADQVQPDYTKMADIEQATLGVVKPPQEVEVPFKMKEKPKDVLKEQMFQTMREERKEGTEGVPKFLAESYKEITGDFLNRSSNAVKKDLEYYLGDAGFTVDDSGYLTLVAPNGKRALLKGANLKTVANEIKAFIKENITSVGADEMTRLQKEYNEGRKKFISEQQIKDEFNVLNESAESLKNEINNTLKEETSLLELQDRINTFPANQRNTAAYQSLVNDYNSRLELFNTNKSKINERIKQTEAKDTNLKKAAGEYVKNKEETGTFTGYLYRKFTEGLGSITAQSTEFFVNRYWNNMRLELALGQDLYKEEMKEAASDLGIDINKVLLTPEYFDKLSDPQKRFAVLEAKRLREDVEAEVRDKFKKISKYGEYRGIELNTTTINDLREYISDKLGPSSTTKEYLQKMDVEGNLIQRGLGGLAGSAPAMIGPPIVRVLNMFSLTTDAVKKEMENDPDFEDVSENEKEMVAIPIGIVGAALEEFGFRNLLKGKSIITDITKRVIGKLPVGATASQIRSAALSEIKEMGLRGGLTLVGAGLAEAETGGLQQVSEFAIKDIYNTMKGKKMFDTPIFMSQDYINKVADAAATEAIGGFVMGVPNAVSAAFTKDGFEGLSDDTFLMFEELSKSSDSKKLFVIDLKNKINEGKITKAEADKILNNYDKSSGLVQQIPDEITDIKDRKKAMDLLKAKKELEDKIQGKDPDLVKPIQSQINTIKEQLSKITQDAIQKQTAGEVPVQPEAGVGEEVVQGEPQPGLEVTTEEGVIIPEEGVTVQEEVAPSETRTAEQEADLLEELIGGKKKEPVVTEAVVEEVISEEDQKSEIPTIEEVGETELEIKDVETTPEETQKQVEEFDEEKLPEQEKPKAGQVAELAIDDINADPERFQYKEVSDKEAGVGEQFKQTKAPFNKEYAGVISVWVDPADGKTYVINGHHRLDFAKRSGEKTMNVIYIDAKNASEARVKGAMQNIAEGQGTDMDAAKIFRETGMTVEQVQASGISVKGAKAMNGLALASLSDNLFNLVAQGKLSQTVGIIIGNTIKNKEVQEQFYNTIKNKNLNNATIKVMAEDIQSAPVETVQMVDLFGETETQQAAYQQRATFIAGIRAIVSKAKNVLGKAAKSASFLEEYGNQIDEVASETGSRESAMALAVFDKLRNTSPEIKQMIDEGVERIKNGENKNKVLNETAKRIIEATPAIVERITGQPVAGRSETKKPSPKGKQGAKVKGEKLADAIRKNLKVKGPGGLQSNILGVPIAIWNAGVETIAKSIEAGMALNDAVQRGINYIKEKHGKRINEASVEKKMLIGIYSGAIKTAREAGISNDGIKKYLERQGATNAQIEALLKYKEKGDKKAPSAEKIVGKPKPKKVTVNEMSALKDQIRLEAKAAREAKGDLNAKRKQLATAINAMVNSGVLTARQAEIIIRRVNLVNLDNPVMVERLLDYADKVFKDAEYANKLKNAKKLQSTAKSLSKNKEKNAEVRELAKEFGKIDPSMVENIDEYIEIASEVVEGVKGSRLTSKGVALASAVDINKTKKYIDKALENQNEKQRELMAAKMQELMGVDVSDLSYDQMMELLSDDKPIDKYKEGIIRDTISRMFDTYSAIIESMFKTGKNPFDVSEDAETVEFKDSQKELVRNFMSIDLNLLTPREALMAVDALNNFIVNGSTANMETVYRNYTGTKNAKTVKDKGIKGKPLSFLFIKSLGRFFLEEFVSLPLLIESMFKSQATALYFSKMMGLNDLANSASQATSITQIAVSNYLKQFSSLKPNKKAFNDAYNATERGMLAFMTRNIIGTEAEMKKEFEYRKKLLEESIKELSEGSTKEQEKAKLYQQAYDKILKDSKDAQEVKQKTDKINADAVDWWINEWSKHYNDMSDVSLNVYNKVLEKDLNYTTDRYARLEMASKDKSELESNASAYFFNNGTMYKKEAGALRETVDKTGDLPKNKDGQVTRYVDLSFDSVQASSLYDAMSDIKTAGAIRQVESFLKSKDLKKVFTPEDLKLLTDRVNLAIRNIRSQVNYDSSELNKLVKNLDRFAKFSATLALAGVTQPFKQTIPLMFNTLINAGSIDPVSILTNNDLREFINNSGRAIANRGVESQVYIESINRLIDQAAKSTPEKAAKFIEKANDRWMKVFLANPDAYIAKASWIAYYEQSLKKQGLYRESIKPITPSDLMTGATVFDGVSGIDYSTHKLNEEAADYAQMMVDRQQNITDTRLAGAMYSDTKGGAYKKILTRLFLPLASFRLNQYFRTKSDLATLFSKSNTFQDKVKAARSLTGLAVEQMIFKSLVIGFGLTYHYISDAIIAAFTGDEEDEEEKEKKWKIRQDNLLKGQATSAVTDLFSPLPAFDPLVKYGANTALDVTQELLDIADENKLSIFVDDPKKVKTYSDAAGMYGIGIDKVLEILKTGDLAFSGKHTDNYGNEKFITKEQQELLKWSLIPSVILNTGVLPGAPEFNNIMGKIKKDIMYSGKTKNQLEESAAFRDYGSRKEFEKADKQGYLKAKNTPGDPLYELNKKEKEERENKKEEEGEPSGGKVDRGPRKLGRGKGKDNLRKSREFGR